MLNPDAKLKKNIFDKPEMAPPSPTSLNPARSKEKSRANTNDMKKGFTLVELLIVIAIIGLLASIVLVGLNSSKAKARDATRKKDLETLQGVLEYYFSQNGSYPSTNGAWYGSAPSGNYNNNNGDWIPGLAPTYLPTLPHDPIEALSKTGTCPAGYYSEYLYRSDGVGYKTLAHCAPEGQMTSSDPFYDPVRPTWAWKVCSGEPACSSW